MVNYKYNIEKDDIYFKKLKFNKSNYINKNKICSKCSNFKNLIKFCKIKSDKTEICINSLNSLNIKDK